MSPVIADQPGYVPPSPRIASPSLSPTEQGVGDPIEATPQLELDQFGISIVSDGDPARPQSDAFLAAANALGARTAELFGPATHNRPDKYEVFKAIYGPTVVRIFTNRRTVDGIHLGLNCGWEGRFAQGCKDRSIFPDRQFPKQAWLILLAADPNTSLNSLDIALATHELVHNVTWAGGHNPSNRDGFSFVHYVGDDFAIKYMDYLGVQIGRDSYVNESARRANQLWRAELTADAVASWALGEISGPYAKIIEGYIHDMMVCEIFGGTLC